MLKKLIKTVSFALVLTTTLVQANNGPIVPPQICEDFPFDCPSMALKSE